MIKYLLNFVNFFRVKSKLKKLNFNFYSEKPITNFSEIQDKEIKIKIAKNIIKFNNQCDFFYNNLPIDESLKISGLWKEYFIKNKNEQIDCYKTNNVEKIILLHENMFYNSLINGLWNYSNFKNLKLNYSSTLLFLKDLDLYKIMFGNFNNLSSNNNLRKWGYQYQNKKFHFIDPSSKIQKNLILNSLNLLENKKFNILEIGGGFGSLAERTFNEKNINSYMIIDIPSSLLIAYYYLGSKFGTENVELINSAEEFKNRCNLNKKKIYLVPSCFFNLVKDLEDFDMLCNFASFSEMGYNTIKYYLTNLPDKIKLIINSNSNIEKKRDTSDNFKEVTIDEFPIPKKFVLSFSSVQIPYFANWRYKTQIWYSKN